MAINSRYVVKFRRRREKRTNYKKRLAYLKSGKPRMVVRLSNKHCLCQVVLYDNKGDKTIAQANSGELAEFGYKGSTGNLPAAYLTGLLCAKRSKKKDVVPDIGFITPRKGNRTFAALKGALDGGMKMNHNDAFPPENRLFGGHTKSTNEKAVKDAAERIKTGKPQKKRAAKGTAKKAKAKGKVNKDAKGK